MSASRIASGQRVFKMIIYVLICAPGPTPKRAGTGFLPVAPDSLTLHRLETDQHHSAQLVAEPERQ